MIFEIDCQVDASIFTKSFFQLDWAEIGYASIQGNMICHLKIWKIEDHERTMLCVSRIFKLFSDIPWEINRNRSIEVFWNDREKEEPMVCRIFYKFLDLTTTSLKSTALVAYHVPLSRINVSVMSHCGLLTLVWSSLEFSLCVPSYINTWGEWSIRSEWRETCCIFISHSKWIGGLNELGAAWGTSRPEYKLKLHSKQCLVRWSRWMKANVHDLRWVLVEKQNGWDSGLK